MELTQEQQFQKDIAFMTERANALVKILNDEGGQGMYSWYGAVTHVMQDLNKKWFQKEMPK